ncbi:MAG: signal peptidase I [Clostridia bacterium]|nr:signal peptidase I [Clostridia bacterium]MDE6758589.1 signal peptidase I [Clostridia bacterium]MDE7079440.1 signal peptidase I [Clostridia bacterium]
MQEDDVNKQENFNYISDEKKSRRLSALNIFLTVIIILLLIALIVFTTTITSIGVRGISMMPNVQEGDRLILLKRGYTLDYGDIVVFHREEDEESAVKRIIAKGGDVISFDKNELKWVRNGEYVEEDYFDGEYSESYFSSMLLELQGKGLTIPDGYLFVLGDNRNMPGSYVSKDSHMYGPLPENTVLGKVIRII